jgi:hypothetical protein
MLIAALRDLQWSRQRFIIAIVGTWGHFAATLVLTGLANGFRIEAQRTVESGIDTFGHAFQPEHPSHYCCPSPGPFIRVRNTTNHEAPRPVSRLSQPTVSTRRYHDSLRRAFKGAVVISLS